jgi:hypothetical protein
MGYMDQVIKKAWREICLHSNNINQEEGFKLSQAWNPAINIYKPVTLRISIIFNGVVWKKDEEQ